ncbi:MAG TPA: transcriptional regulator [Erwinia persicina]|uniref:Transcriptional regulator n=3 Tax=Erwinia persicina TaxID=55211 RepID=A0A3Q8H877_9GAMM|nr:biofilm/acid-resistance regulator YmgB/AriR [Erwinia persicina]AXU97856.1 transcriptional regulator [Erwinia persicina]MBC3945902.1 transcriptional regulator [Erwinia persicina]MBD8105420.1 transcriptional regulator [Erwinia persicina]MBD8166019.1 transcriptional regulator [Erwinia persicina]MBD8208566.1 transcriptional regulator [Erwinia persicina]
MQQMSSESEILSYFQGGGEKFSQEAQVLGAVIKELATGGRHVNNKAIILKLIEKLETTSDVIQLDVYRQVLEVVVGMTPDDA